MQEAIPGHINVSALSRVCVLSHPVGQEEISHEWRAIRGLTYVDSVHLPLHYLPPLIPNANTGRKITTFCIRDNGKRKRQAI